MKTLFSFLVIGTLWIISIPCTLLVILFQLAKDNADNVYLWIDEGIKEEKPARMSFKEKLEQRMKENPPPKRNG